jgi:hypothetical protein
MGRKLVIALISISAFSLASLQADHERSTSAASGIHSSPRKAARTHSSSPHSAKKEKASRENKTQNKTKRRSASNRDRDRARDATDEQNLVPTPPVDLPDREDGEPEADVQSDEESSANLMSAATQIDENGGD